MYYNLCLGQMALLPYEPGTDGSITDCHFGLYACDSSVSAAGTTVLVHLEFTVIFTLVKVAASCFLNDGAVSM